MDETGISTFPKNAFKLTAKVGEGWRGEDSWANTASIDCGLLVTLVCLFSASVTSL